MIDNRNFKFFLSTTALLLALQATAPSGAFAMDGDRKDGGTASAKGTSPRHRGAGAGAAGAAADDGDKPAGGGAGAGASGAADEDGLDDLDEAGLAALELKAKADAEELIIRPWKAKLRLERQQYDALNTDYAELEDSALLLKGKLDETEARLSAETAELGRERTAHGATKGQLTAAQEAHRAALEKEQTAHGTTKGLLTAAAAAQLAAQKELGNEQTIHNATKKALEDEQAAHRSTQDQLKAEKAAHSQARDTLKAKAAAEADQEAERKAKLEKLRQIREQQAKAKAAAEAAEEAEEAAFQERRRKEAEERQRKKQLVAQSAKPAQQAKH